MKEKVYAITRPIIKLVISLIVLGIIDVIAVRLPGGERILYIGENLLAITISTIVGAAIGIVIICVILKFGAEIRSSIRGALTDFLEFSIVAKNLIYLAAIWVAYGVLRGVALPFLREATWVYPLAFFVISLLPLYGIARSLLVSVDKWSSLIQSRIEKGEAIIECPECKKTIPSGSQFCSYCGIELTEPEKKEEKKCFQCGAELLSDALYCQKCGAKI